MDAENTLQQRDDAISFVRLIATVMIVICHMMQYEEYFLAWWLNVGVQIFLCMSGYLYGRKKFSGTDISFYKKQFTKILTDYYVVIGFAILIQWLLVPTEITWQRVIESLLTYKTLEGGGHMWYIPYILFCYFLTPFLIRLFNDWNEKNKNFFLVIGILILLFVCFIISKTFLPYFNSAWISCYIIGLFLGFCVRENKFRLLKNMIGAILLVALCLNEIQIYIQSFSGIELVGETKKYYNLLYSYAHVALGCSLFFILKWGFSRIFMNGSLRGVTWICKYSDRLSYDVYLVHLFFILGPLSLMELTSHLAVNIAIICVLVLLAAILTNFIATRIRSWKLLHGENQSGLSNKIGA